MIPTWVNSQRGSGGIPANAIYDRSGALIYDRAGSFIETRV